MKMSTLFRGTPGSLAGDGLNHRATGLCRAGEAVEVACSGHGDGE